MYSVRGEGGFGSTGVSAPVAGVKRKVEEDAKETPAQ
jgi:hypothetical protein